MSDFIFITAMVLIGLVFAAMGLYTWNEERARRAHYAAQDAHYYRPRTPSKASLRNQEFENWDAQFESRPARDLIGCSGSQDPMI